jgi:nucleoside-diphosphate-sugar epimerase
MIAQDCVMTGEGSHATDLPLSDLPIVQPDDEGAGDEGIRTVLITGAGGNIGRKLRAAWADRYDLILLDRQANDDDPDIIFADLAEPDEEWMELFEEADIVVHLAANPNEFAPWEELVAPNMDALANVLLASARAGVERVVFASSNHAMGGYRERDETPISVDLPARPGNFYGATKLMGERLGRSLALSFELTFVALRIGWVQKGENLPETLPDDWARHLWLSNEDMVALFTRAVEAELEPGAFVVVNGLSSNPGSRWSRTEAQRSLGIQ